MGAGSVGMPRDTKDSTPREGGRLVAESEGQGGVSDKRRAELEQLEAGVGPAVDASTGRDKAGTSAERIIATAAEQTADTGGRATLNTGSVKRDA